jgi:hypothetical protein
MKDAKYQSRSAMGYLTSKSDYIPIKNWRLPHIHPTEDKEWNPSVLDCKIPENWCKEQRSASGSLIDAPYDIHGRLKNSFIPQDDPNVLPDDEGEHIRDVKNELNANNMEFGVLYVGREEIDVYFQNIIDDKLVDDPLLFTMDKVVHEAEKRGNQDGPR